MRLPSEIKNPEIRTIILLFLIYDVKEKLAFEIFVIFIVSHTVHTVQYFCIKSVDLITFVYKEIEEFELIT